MTATTQTKPVSIIRQLAAVFYDSLLLIAISLGTCAVMIGLRVLLNGPIPPAEPALQGLWRPITFVTVTLANVHFFIYFWCKMGQTLGMQTWKLRLADANNPNKNVTYWQAWKRLLAAWLGGLSLGLGFWWPLLTNQPQWQDQYSNSQLQYSPHSG